MRRINSHEDLKREQLRLNSRRVFLEKEIKRNFNELKEELEPVKLLGKSAEKTLLAENNKVVGNVVGQFANFLAKNTLRRSGFVTRLLVPYLIKNITSNLVEKNKSQLVGWIGGLLTRLNGKKTLHGKHAHGDEI